MSDLIAVTGMVISTMPVGDYDRRVVLLTRERGKISAFAKGARRPNNKLNGSVMPCAFGTFWLYEGKTSYTIHSAEISNYFSELRMDMEAAYYAFYFFEIAEYYAREANDETQLLGLLYQTMRILTKKVIPLKLVRYIYELKAVTLNGEGPQMFECVKCQGDSSAGYFSARAGGMVCSQCERQYIDAMRLQMSTVYTMQYIVSSSLEKLYTFNVNAQVLEELGRVMERYMEVYVNHRFKSLEILEQITI